MADTPVFGLCVAHVSGRMIQATTEVQQLPGRVVALRVLRSGTGELLFAVHMTCVAAAVLGEDLGTDADAPIRFEPCPSSGARDMFDDYPDKGDALLEVPL